MDIGESSNVAQIGLSYTYNHFGKDFEGLVGILACLAQCAIDNAKRTFDIDIHAEIQRLKNEMNIRELGYPAFFAGVNPQKRSKVNPNIICPMNRVYMMKNKQMPISDIKPISEFFVKHKNKESKYISKKVEAFIEDYINKLIVYESASEHYDEEYLLLRSDYDELIRDLRKLTLSDKYVGLMSWLLDRAFTITPEIKRGKSQLRSRLNKNRSILLKTLYDLNQKSLKKCFK